MRMTRPCHRCQVGDGEIVNCLTSKFVPKDMYNQSSIEMYLIKRAIYLDEYLRQILHRSLQLAKVFISVLKQTFHN